MGFINEKKFKKLSDPAIIKLPASPSNYVVNTFSAFTFIKTKSRNGAEDCFILTITSIQTGWEDDSSLRCIPVNFHFSIIIFQKSCNAFTLINCVLVILSKKILKLSFKVSTKLKSLNYYTYFSHKGIRQANLQTVPQQKKVKHHAAAYRKTIGRRALRTGGTSPSSAPCVLCSSQQALGVQVAAWPHSFTQTAPPHRHLRHCLISAGKTAGTR